MKIHQGLKRLRRAIQAQQTATGEAAGLADAPLAQHR
jgi:hypothetical protein